MVGGTMPYSNRQAHVLCTSKDILALTYYLAISVHINDYDDRRGTRDSWQQ
jgi:hypothetical protein